MNDGPKGGIWYVEPSRLELVTALVEELESLNAERGRVGERKTGIREDKAKVEWRVLGEGRGRDRGRVFLIHGCGWGPRVVGDGGGEGGGKEGEGEVEEVFGEVLSAGRGDGDGVVGEVGYLHALHESRLLCS